jgi:hypothetical protein
MKHASLTLQLLLLVTTAEFTLAHKTPRIAVAVASTTARAELLAAGRCWRNGLPTVIATNASSQDAAKLTKDNKQHNEVNNSQAVEIVSATCTCV